MGTAADRMRRIVVVGLASPSSVRGGGVMHPLLLAALVTAATWDAWRWYLARVAAAPEEATALALTVTFLGVLGVARMTRPAPPHPLPVLTVAIMLAAYAASHIILPPIVRAALAISVT